MDFFESQARAHRRTKWLLVYFALAVVGIIVTLQGLAAWALGESPLDPHLLLMVSGGVVAVVTIGSLYRIAELSRGGGVVAEMLGGRQLDPHPTDLRELQLRNVVEEMSLASGVPVPDIYVLDNEAAINAFAAGNTPGDAVVAVTRGTLDQLTRDELQGVVAHEFSHILNGDMRLNLRLMGALNGILLLAIIGRLVFEIGGRSGSTVRSDRDGKNSALPLFAVGAAIWLVGWIGVFFAKLIKAAVSRQREFLADASAVQFTRNPDGIAGALAKIGRGGSRLATPRAEEASHLFFGNGLGDSWGALFATHPPIPERIAAIKPGLAAELAESAPLPAAAAPDSPEAAVAGFAGVPAGAREAARETPSAVPLLYALLVSADPATRARQLAGLTVTAGERAEIDRAITRRADITDALSLMNLSLPALRRLSPAQYATFRDNVRRLIATDGEVDLLEFVLHHALVRHVDHFFTPSRGPAVRYRSPVPLLPDIGVVLSALANAAAADRDAGFQAGVSALLLKPGAFPLERAPQVAFEALGAALDHCAEADPATRQKIMNACRATVETDHRAEPHEQSLLRAIADALGCPTPIPDVSPELGEALGIA